MPTRLDLGTTRPTLNTDLSATTRPTVAKKLPPPQPHIELPPKLGRPPTTNDLIITRCFDGLTPAQAHDRIVSKHQGAIAPENRRLVDTTVNARVRDMQVALNNVFTRGTPNNKFLAGQLPADITLLGSLSSTNPIVYQVAKPNQPVKYFTRGWSGQFVELPKPPGQVVMQAKVQLEPAGLLMTYPNWQNKALAGQITTITEL